MKIKKIVVENVRGISRLEFEPVGGVLPNKPSILVAPNGSGKSSFATAFASLNRQRLKLAEEDRHNEDENLDPLVSIQTDEPGEPVYTADKNKNGIYSHFGISVINSGMHIRNSGGMYPGKPKLEVPNIIILKNKPADPIIVNNFQNVMHLEGQQRGLVPGINDLLKNYDFLSSIPYNQWKSIDRILNFITDSMARISAYDGTLAEKHGKIEAEEIPLASRHPKLQALIDKVRGVCPADRLAKVYLKAVQMIWLYKQNPNLIDGRIAYLDFVKKEGRVRDLFRQIKTTWKDIKPVIDHGTFALSISDVTKISNGERDFLTFVANMCKAQLELTKQHNILIIDEVFDYLDDANMMAAQYFVSQMIDDLKSHGKNIFVLMLTHINPSYYKTHAFQKMKVYYLVPMPNPNVSDLSMKIIRQRAQDKVNNNDNISTYLFHFHPDTNFNIQGFFPDCPAEWNTMGDFKAHCKRQLEKYLGNEVFDPIGVCIALREIIESNLYYQLQAAHQPLFLQEKRTLNKMDFTQDKGIDVPEIFYILGNLYNEPLHANDKSNKSISQTLYSRLSNSLIQNMVGILVEKYGRGEG